MLSAAPAVKRGRYKLESVNKLRIDGRLPDQLRPTKFTPDYLVTAEGSVIVEAGNTRVLCAASVENSVPGFLRGTGKGWITAEYGDASARDVYLARPARL